MKTRCYMTILVALLSAGLFGFPAAGAEPKYPALYNSVHDFAGVLTPETEASLTKLIDELRKKTSDALAVVTIDTTAPVSLEEYAVKLFQNVGRSPDGRYGLGDKGKDNGVLILVAIKDQQARIEVGYGLEGTITDAQASGIIRNIMRPLFRRGDFDGGIEQATRAVIGLIAKASGQEIEGAAAPEKISTSSQGSQTSLGWIFPLVVLALILFSLLRAGGRRSGKGSRSGGFWTGGGTGGFSGGFGGGGGGFGGGMSGGGGASGGW